MAQPAPQVGLRILPFPLASVLAGAFVTLLGFVLLLNIFGLPANWLLLGLVALWKLIHPAAQSMDVVPVLMVGIALAGEALEMGLQIVKARRYGSSSSGTFAGMIGAIAGAILLAPLFFGWGRLSARWPGPDGLLMELVRVALGRGPGRGLGHDGPFRALFAGGRWGHALAWAAITSGPAPALLAGTG